jgi:hypothetical protein
VEQASVEGEPAGAPCGASYGESGGAMAMAETAAVSVAVAGGWSVGGRDTPGPSAPPPAPARCRTGPGRAALAPVLEH